jgi:hypothetical protein
LAFSSTFESKAILALSAAGLERLIDSVNKDNGKWALFIIFMVIPCCLQLSVKLLFLAYSKAVNFYSFV